jgi:predicted small secreted protein
LGWIGSLAAILAATSSFFQNNWMNAASLWLSAIGMVSFASLGFVGAHVAVPICLTAVTVSLGWALLADGAAKKADCAIEKSSKSTKNGSNWLLSVALLGAFSSAGGLLFASAGGFVALYAESMQQSPARAAVVLLCSFLVSACGARVAWQLGTAFKHESEKSFIQGRWLSIPVLVIFVGFGVFWNGTLTGLDASIFSDRVLGSVLERISPNGRGDSVNTLVIGVHFALLLTSILIAWWNGASGVGPFRKFVAYAPRLSAFVSGGYGTERAFAGLADAFRFVGRHLQTWIDEKFSNTWAPYVLNRGAQSAGRAFGKVDRALSNLIARVAYALSTAATGAVQSAHTGNLQWYVTFAIGAGISLLIHFLVSQQ